MGHPCRLGQKYRWSVGSDLGTEAVVPATVVASMCGIGVRRLLPSGVADDLRTGCSSGVWTTVACAPGWPPCLVPPQTASAGAAAGAPKPKPWWSWAVPTCSRWWPEPGGAQRLVASWTLRDRSTMKVHDDVYPTTNTLHLTGTQVHETAQVGQISPPGDTLGTAAVPVHQW